MSDSAWPDGSKWSGGTSGMNNGQYGDPSDSPDVTRIQSFSLPVRPQSQPPQSGHEEQQDTVPGQQEQPGQVPLPGQEYSASAHRVPPAAQELGTSTYRIPPSAQDFAQQAQSAQTAPQMSAQAAPPMSQDFGTTVQPVPQDLRRGSAAPADYQQQQPPAAPAFQPSSQDFATTVQAVPGLQRGPADFHQAPAVQDYHHQPPASGYQQPTGYQQPQPGSGYQQASGYPAYPGGGQPFYPAQPDAYGSGAVKPQSNTMATTALVCSVLWGAGVTALIGLIVGFIALNQIKQNGGEGKDRATTAIWVGGIGVVLAIILFVA